MNYYMNNCNLDMHAMLHCNGGDHSAVFFYVVLQGISLKTHSAPTIMSRLRAGMQTLWQTVPFSWLVTQRSRVGPETDRKLFSAGQLAPSSQRRSWRLCVRLTARAATWWWGCPTLAVSGVAARVKSVPFAENVFPSQTHLTIHDSVHIIAEFLS